MKKYICYDTVKLFAWLLILNALCSCVSIRQKLGIDNEGKVSSVSKNPTVASVEPIVNPMVLSEDVINDLYNHSFSQERIDKHWLGQQGLDINAEDKHKRTLLMYVICFFQEKDIKKETCKFMIDKGANVDAQDQNGITPLMLSLWLRIEPIFYMLLEAKANPLIKVKAGIKAKKNLPIESLMACMETEIEGGMDAEAILKIHSYCEDQATKKANEAQTRRMLKLLKLYINNS